jgi:hypothetical protein
MNNPMMTKALQKSLKLSDSEFAGISAIAKNYIEKAVETGEVNYKEFNNDPKISELKAAIKPEHIQAALKFASNFMKNNGGAQGTRK